jgi:hypothetical protein
MRCSRSSIRSGLGNFFRLTARVRAGRFAQVHEFKALNEKKGNGMYVADFQKEIENGIAVRRDRP